MHGQAMEKIVKSLKQSNVPLSDMTALEFFARDGSWQTVKYSKEIGTLHAWEIDASFLQDLETNLPLAKIMIGNSFSLATEKKYRHIFQMIVFDNPQAIFGPHDEYCEHFEALPLLKLLARNNYPCVIIFNVNSHPFNYGSWPAWQKRRNEFYHVEDATSLNLDQTMSFYKNYFKNLSFNVKKSFVVDRNSDYLHYFIFILESLKEKNGSRNEL